MTPHQFALLELLCRHVGKVLMYDTILNAICGFLKHSEVPGLRVHMPCFRHDLHTANPLSQ
ncbi:helix-turn-helix domain-containing protein, partial [Staphylococcus pseudintermedius]|uniref:helix-turn-helix domain-containing protein n=1 Tax=Staphylococcus pseudintermedius TaxID=283734 RepID=UPI002287241D